MTAMRRFNDTGIPLLIARLVVGGTLIASSLHKIEDPVSFLKLVNQYGLVPADWPMVLNLIAVLIPWLELVGGVALILGLGLRGVGAMTLLMLIGFTTAIALRTPGEMARSGKSFWEVEFSCGCADSAPEIIWWKLTKNTGLIILAVLITLSNSRRLCLSALLARMLRPGAATADRPRPGAGGTRPDEDPDLAELSYSERG